MSVCRAGRSAAHKGSIVSNPLSSTSKSCVRGIAVPASSILAFKYFSAHCCAWKQTVLHTGAFADAPSPLPPGNLLLPWRPTHVSPFSYTTRPRDITSVMNESPSRKRRATSSGARTRISTGKPAPTRRRISNEGRLPRLCGRIPRDQHRNRVWAFRKRASRTARSSSGETRAQLQHNSVECRIVQSQ